MEVLSCAEKANLIKKILGTVSIKAADAREFLELDIWLGDIGAGVLIVSPGGAKREVVGDAGG